LIQQKVESINDFNWEQQLRYYQNLEEKKGGGEDK